MPLRPVAEPRTVRVRGDRALVTDGPFAETTEWIAGYDRRKPRLKEVTTAVEQYQTSSRK